MSYASLMVHLQLGQANTQVLQTAADLASRFRATVVGIAACQPMQMAYGDAYISGDVIQLDRTEIAQEMADAEAQFRSALQAHAERLEWRSTVGYTVLSEYLAREARSVDLVVTGAAKGELLDTTRAVDTGDLVMQAGRPVLVVPPNAGPFKLDQVLVGWKDTRESRRAAYDAVPLLQKAGRVVVVDIAAESELALAHARLADVVVWLGRHGVAAEPLVVPSTGDDAARLGDVALQQGADLVVAGAYGHSRLREWALGGVTRSLLQQSQCCVLASH